ncbi:MAG: hypothetical protein J6A15_01415 [Clostridia bacterium]|nr:hypothetical protein [Clostridia bacterium]MBP3905844.1 hypothetical protein [Peptostreptococcaceae bacterium]
MITNKIEFTREVIEANKNLITAICELMETNHDIKIEDVQDINIYEEGNDILTIEVEGFKFVVSDDYTALEELAMEQVKEIIEDCGLTENLIFEAELQGWINEEYFKEYWDDLHYSMAYDEGIYNIMDSEEVDLYESGELSEEDIRENYYNSLQDSIQNNWIDEFKFQFGDDLFNDIVIKENLINIEELAKWCVEMDGVAHTLATYDGQEEEFNGFYFFRTN